MRTTTTTIYKNGAIYTVNPNNPAASAVAVQGERIIAVGDDEYVEAKAAELTAGQDSRGSIERIDLAGKFMLPGFIEAHAHPSLAGVELVYQVDLSSCFSRGDYVEKIRDFIKAHPSLDFIQGAGWINPHFDLDGPRKELLDEISNDIPIVMISGDHHSIWANSKAIGLAGVTKDTPSPEGGVIERDSETGEPLGTFREEAQDLIRSIIPPYSVEQFENGFLAYQQKMAAYGYTMSHDAMLYLNSNQHQALKTLDDAGRLLFKMSASFVTEVNKPDKIKDYRTIVDVLNGEMFYANHIKFFLDGVVEGRTAYLKEAYADQNDFFGTRLWEDETLYKALSIVEDLGFEAHFHIIGDAAAKQMIDALNKLAAEKGQKKRRPIAAHTQIIDEADFQSMADFDQLIICANPYWFIKADGYFDGIEKPLLGSVRAEKEYPMKTFFDLGMTVTSASDFSVTPDPNPLSGIQLGTMRCLPEERENPAKILGPDQRVSVEDMIRTFTINAAYAVSMENITGSIEEGKLADLVILDTNILEMPAYKIPEAKVLRTVSNGKIIYDKLS